MVDFPHWYAWEYFIWGFVHMWHVNPWEQAGLQQLYSMKILPEEGPAHRSGCETLLTHALPDAEALLLPRNAVGVPRPPSADNHIDFA